MALASFWNRDGQRERLPVMPSSFERWTIGDDIEPSRRKLLDRIEAALSSKVMSTDVRSAQRNLVLEIELEDGRREIVRAPVQGQELSAWSQDMFESEVALLSWLSERTSLPVPRIRCVVRRSECEPQTFAVMEKLPGDCLLNVFGDLPFSGKESLIRATAEMMLQLHNVEVPQRIGTTLVRDNVVNIIPLLAPRFTASTSRVFDTLEEYIDALIEGRRASNLIDIEDADRSSANAVLDRLVEELPPILHRLSAPAYRRCVLSHGDLHGANVLIDHAGRISGLVDWEFHSTRPLVLEAQYPAWIQYDGAYDPRFAQEGMWWFCSPEDAAKLRVVYAEAIKTKDEDYWRALTGGELLRQIEGWLTVGSSESDCRRMAAWMNTVFP
ncbi:kinase-like protein [Polyporus arcularius HHB13444]|uniref:Kinase-like protein n=1 Tax=Polyporus arcularius HHB13444 TaxID=1314778 RepID=A0A5C3PKH0_9APHY|nr:kinase-like protein [Polyporus arcularius HHB13444]